VLAAANPKHGRWDPYDPKHEQIEIDAALLSRFGLIWCFEDDPDEERDRAIAESMLTTKDVAKRLEFSHEPVPDEERAAVDPPLPPTFLRKYIAYARQHYYPRFADESVKQEMQDGYVSLRAANGYDEDAAVPISSRKLQDVLRLAEASARARLSETIDSEDVARAQELIGASMREFQTNEDGDMDIDTVESGTSKTQKERIEQVKQLILDLQGEDPLPMGRLITEAEDELGLSKQKTKRTVENMKKKGIVYNPQGEGTIRAFK